MRTTEAPEVEWQRKKVAPAAQCYHCGQPCLTRNIAIGEKLFCCDGCKLVYGIINDSGLCNYYELERHPGLSQIKVGRNDKFAFLDDDSIIKKLVSFTDGNYTLVTFYVPGVHCSSCMWLLEHLHRLNEGITESRLNFSTKEVTVRFLNKKVSLRQLAELMSTIGYEPYISLDDADGKKAVKPDRRRIYRLGVAGFCFANIMMMSFPEYLGGLALEHRYTSFLRILNLMLALPVFFFSAGEFFSTAWNGLKARTLNIDAPIALAILITFSRSLYEIVSGSGPGYLDSMSGIVFFMLVGRVVQERTYRSVSFHRNYKSYFPIAVTVHGSSGPETRSLHDIRQGDIVELHSDDIIPADGTLLNGNARIDYSFVTGESDPVRIEEGGHMYAGGRQTGDKMVMLVQKPVAGSYLTSLWNHHAFTRNKSAEANKRSFTHALSRYFTVILFTLTAATGMYWSLLDSTKALNAVTAMLIVACPCALLLSATFTNGNLLRIFSNAGLFLRDATVIEQLGKVDHIVFDKTGTLTRGNEVKVIGDKLISSYERSLLHSAVCASKHPYSRALAACFKDAELLKADTWKEYAGRGIDATINGSKIKVGSPEFTGADSVQANVYAEIDGNLFAFEITPHFRSGLSTLVNKLRRQFSLSLLSGDNARQKIALQKIFGGQSTMLFGQQPVDKLSFIEMLQSKKHTVMMIGDGLNDAGALQQSDVGITLAEDVNNFTPACDAILGAKSFSSLPALLQLALWGRRIILLSFIVSLLYNIGGLFFAMQGRLNPMIAAILMPASTLSIVLLSTGISALVAWKLGLSKNTIIPDPVSEQY